MMSCLTVLGPRLLSAVTTRTVSRELAATRIVMGYNYELGIVGMKNRSTSALHENEQKEMQRATVTTGDGNNNEDKKRIVSYNCELGIVGVKDRRDLALHEKEQEGKQKATVSSADGNNNEEKRIVSYWGLESPEFTKEDGTKWRWSCSRPWESYRADISIDLEKHHAPATFTDKMAFWTVKALRWPIDIFFQRRYGCRAMMLETVVTVPAMVGGMMLHCKSLSKFEHSGGWIKALWEEAENERMHLITFMEVAKPRWYERALLLPIQGVIFIAYSLGYLISPKLAHRIVGYLEEEAIHSYTEFLKELEKGNIENVPAPAIAIDYWRLPPDSTLRDVVMVVRANKAHHRDVNHFASDIYYQGRELSESAAPIGYTKK
ncbi:ubiquinol oxidase 2, mitochondrial-like [Mangifera indica]|uniref:ubiquinol oxidase 2, mitochondrial-like n=1 Tax=Mangifera indica TaxID=29780 RepID=UPI001CFBC434|nr:ubiquinol oxidase 2, mitochondrial-like [Mangifera indica]